MAVGEVFISSQRSKMLKVQNLCPPACFLKSSIPGWSLCWAGSAPMGLMFDTHDLEVECLAQSNSGRRANYCTGSPNAKKFNAFTRLYSSDSQHQVFP